MSDAAESNEDPYLVPQTTLGSRVGRALWGVVYLLLFRPSPRPFHAWRALLLRCFGAKIGPDCHIYPSARIWAPWNLRCADVVAIADGVEVYNAWPVTLNSHAVVSQGAYLCAATHDVDDPARPTIGAPINIGAHAWVCARAIVLPGVALHEGAVLGAGAVATKNLDAWWLYGGNPAQRLRERRRQSQHEADTPA
jgi:putative colanic acid biosynthesis acetyltransferase WcaF